MTTNETVRETLNRANPNSLNDALRPIAIGDIMTQYLPRKLIQQIPTVTLVGLSGTDYDGIALPNALKASRIRRAWARVATGGGGTVGEMTAAAINAAPIGNQIGISPAGDIIFLGTDLYTLVDVEYEPAIGKVITLTGLTVVPGTGVCALPAWVTALNPHKLISAASTAGGLVATMTPLYRAAAAPATTFAVLNLIGNQVLFAVADAVTQATVTLIVQNDVADPHALLLADTQSP